MSLLQNSNAISAGGAYNITDSLRFRSSASAYLERTPTTAGNRKTWTWSAWVKRGTINVLRVFGAATSSTNETTVYFDSNNKLGFVSYIGSENCRLLTTQVFRDTSAWYHILISFDSTQATSSNRIKIYVNGSQITAFDTATYPSQNYDSLINNTISHYYSSYNASFHFDGYISETYLIDGQALTPSDFGETNADGVWSPKKYTGTYGTNGFYLNFSDGTSTTTLGYDYSGNSNNWTTNNISLTAGTTYDLMSDTPSLADEDTGNFATLNPSLTNVTYSPTLSDGNLKLTGGASTVWYTTTATMATPTSGKWYWEYRIDAVPAAQHSMVGIIPNQPDISGIISNNTYVGYSAAEVTNSVGYYSVNGSVYHNNVAYSYGNSYTTGDIIGVALDVDNGKLWFSKNGVWQNSGNPVTGINDVYGAIGGGVTYDQSSNYFPSMSVFPSGATSINFGQRPFAYTPPTGYKKLNTYNLPDSNITDGSEYFNTVLYTGDGTTNNPISVGFSPDLVWIKSRSNVTNQLLQDSVRGNSSSLFSDSTSAELGGFIDITSTGFTNKLDNPVNNSNGYTYASWNWRASDSTAVSNTDGTITSTVSANTTSGFSIISYTGVGSASNTDSVGHGLNEVPQIYIVKDRTSAYLWGVRTNLIDGSHDYLVLNATNAKVNSSVIYPTNTIAYLGGSQFDNANGHEYIAYAFHSVEGFSKFGSYIGNGSTDGPFIYTGFKPAWVMIKRTDSSTAGNWVIWDNKRNTFNEAANYLLANSSSAEGSSGTGIDLLSNGWKIRSVGGGNTSGGTYIYMAFAEVPTKLALAR